MQNNLYTVKSYDKTNMKDFALSPLRVQAHIVIRKKFIFSYNDLVIQIHIFLGYYLPKLSNNIYSLKFY